jgi:hypothetical protein
MRGFMVTQTEKRMDWHLFWTTAGVIVVVVGVVMGCYINLISKISESTRELSKEITSVNNEVVKIQTIMIIKGIVPAELFAANQEVKK